MFYQVVPEFYLYDAISQHARHIQRMLNDLGIASEICAQRVLPEDTPDVRDVKSCLARLGKGDVLLFHFSIHTPLLKALKSLPGRKVMIYHNITPARFFEGISRKAAEACRQGRAQLSEAAADFDLALGVSTFNERELKAAGYRDTGVLPLVVETNVRDHRSARILYHLSEKVTLLHVGKWAPNKKIEDVVKVFYWVHRMIPESRLLLIGRSWEWENYAEAIRRLIHRLGLQESIRTVSNLPAPELAALYRAGDLYLSMSEHEGFCAPLVEAMASRCPVFAFEAGAVPETLQGNGILFKRKVFHEMAEGICALMENPPFINRLTERALHRASDFCYGNVFNIFQSLMPIISGNLVS